MNPIDRGLLILTSLAAGSKHGYALMQDIEEFSGIALGPGTLYGALQRLEADGLVRELATDGRRRPFELSGEGRRVLQQMLSEQARLAGIGLSRLAGSDPRPGPAAHSK